MIIDIHTHLAQYFDKPKQLAHLLDVADRGLPPQKLIQF